MGRNYSSFEIWWSVLEKTTEKNAILDRFACVLLHVFELFFNFSLQTGHTALQRAAAEGHLEIVKTLLENGISVDHQDEVVSFFYHQKKLTRKSLTL